MLTSTVFRNAYFLITLMASCVSAAAAVGSDTPSSTSLSTNGTLEAGIGMAGPAEGYYTISYSNAGDTLYLGTERGSRQIGLVSGGSSDGNPGPSWLITEASGPTYYLKLESKFVNPFGRTLALDDYPFAWIIRPASGPNGFGWRISSPRDGAQWEIPLVYPDAPVIIGARGAVLQLN